MNIHTNVLKKRPFQYQKIRHSAYVMIVTIGTTVIKITSHL